MGIYKIFDSPTPTVCAHFPGGFDPFKDAEVDEDPGQQKQEEELPSQDTRLLHTTGPLQHLKTDTHTQSTSEHFTDQSSKAVTMS